MAARVRLAIDFVSYQNNAGRLFDAVECCDETGGSDRCDLDPCDYTFTACLDEL